MIKYLYVEGYKETCFHDIELSQTHEGFELSKGDYFLMNEKVFSLETPLNISVSIPNETTHFHVVLCKDQLTILQRKENEMYENIEDCIDLIAFFTLEPGYTSFMDADIYFKKVGPINESNQ
ncbi:hypothetical protein M4D55_23485 [Metabacillus idriensis]|uniref:hypothetical protein n=1 Tax=Metabacillus idriensis TaxID=324768 RepID=UPI00203C6D97|nr:hypothetical protein [Metabacillus idriensis]MCM3598726.1 hypothetical protein [Metabacillus idriensis]